MTMKNDQRIEMLSEEFEETNDDEPRSESKWDERKGQRLAWVKEWVAKVAIGMAKEMHDVIWKCWIMFGMQLKSISQP